MKNLQERVSKDEIDLKGKVGAAFGSYGWSGEAPNMLLEIMKQKLESGGDILISGFGKFCVKEKRERKGRNPATGDGMMLEPRRVVTFKCSGKLRDKINQSTHQ